MMKRIFLAGALLSALFQSAVAHAGLQVEDAYVRGLPPGVLNTAAFMRLTNTGDTPLELVGGSTPAAGQVQLHGMMNHGGMLHMMRQTSLTIPAGGELRLESGGNHLMLLDLREELTVGALVELTLEFADGTTHVISAPVRSVLDE